MPRRKGTPLPNLAVQFLLPYLLGSDILVTGGRIVLKQVLTLTLRSLALEPEFYNFITERLIPFFDETKYPCAFRAWRSDPARTSPLYQLEVTYFNEAAYRVLGGGFDFAGAKDWAGDLYSFETYVPLRSASPLVPLAFGGTNVVCSLQNCPNDPDGRSARKCSHDPNHQFCDHNLVYCPSCPSGTQNRVT